MPVDQVMESVTDSSNYVAVGSIVGGYLVSEQVTGRVVNAVNDQLENPVLPTETEGVVTALGFYAVGDTVISQETANFMAYGGLLDAVDDFTDRKSVQNLWNDMKNGDDE